MKILTIVWSIGIGGTERAAVNYAIGYKKFGNHSRVLVLGEGHERYRDLADQQVDTILVTKSNMPPEDIFSELKKWQPDIIHIHNYTDDIIKYVNLIKHTNTKVVETNVFSRPNFSSGYRAVDFSMQLSAWGYWKYTRWMKNANYCPQTAIVPYIVDLSKFNTPSQDQIQSFLNGYNIPKDAFVIGRLGQAHQSKWDVRLVEVINQTIQPENSIYYLLVGVPANLRDLFNKQTYLFKSRVVQINKIEGDINLSVYYHSLNCFAHISKIGESFGYVLAEALYCRIPVVTLLTPLKDNAQFEVTGHNYGGFCVTDTAGFIKKILVLYSDSKVGGDIRNNLSGWIEKRFSYEVVMPVQLNFYRILMENGTIPPANVTSIIDACFSLYRYNKFYISLASKCINHRFFYKLLEVLNGIKK